MLSLPSNAQALGAHVRSFDHSRRVPWNYRRGLTIATLGEDCPRTCQTTKHSSSPPTDLLPLLRSMNSASLFGLPGQGLTRKRKTQNRKSLPQPMDMYTLTDSNVTIHNCTVYDSQRKAVYKISSKQLAETAIVRIREARNTATNLAEISFPWTKDITYRDETLSRPSFSIRIPCIDPNSPFKHASVWMPRADLSERRDGRALHTSVRSEDAYESLTHSCIGLDIWTYLLQRHPSRQFGTKYTDRTQTMAGGGR